MNPKSIISVGLENQLPQQGCFGAVPFSAHVLRSFEEVEGARHIWSFWRSRHRDSDLDFCMQFVWTRQEVIRPHVIVVCRDGQPQAMLVGRLERTTMASKVGYLRLPGIGMRLLNFSYGGFLGDPSARNAHEVIASITDALKMGEADAALLDRPSVDDPLYLAGVTLPGTFTRDRLTKPESHYFMSLSDDLDAVYNSFSPGLRADVRRKTRKVLKDFDGKVNIRSVTAAAELDSVIPQIEEISTKTYQRGLGVGFQDTDLMRRRLRLCAEMGWLRIYLLSLDSRPCAFWVGTVYEGSFCSDYLAFDPSLGEYSPGTFLMGQVIEALCKSGVKEIDFGPGDARYKERFGNRRLKETPVYIFAPGVRGIALNAVRTTTGATDQYLKNALDRTNLLPRIKKLWRARLAKQTTNE